MDKKRKLPKIRQTLGFLLETLQGTEIVVEMKNDSEVRGIVDKSDNGMNMFLLSATQTLFDGRTQYFEQLHVMGSKIRYVHIPKHININALVTAHIEKLDRLKKKTQPRKIVDRIPKRTLQISSEDITLETAYGDDE